jgi:hypothetical protein
MPEGRWLMDTSDLICLRCSKPVRPETAARNAPGPVHVRCLAGETLLETLEQHDTARRLIQCARAAVSVAVEILIERSGQTHCGVCGHSLLRAGSVLFQGGQFVHALCWRDEQAPAAPPSAA